MSSKQVAEFTTQDGSIIRACDFGTEFPEDKRYLTLPDLQPIIPTDQPGVFIVPRHNLKIVRRDRESGI